MANSKGSSKPHIPPAVDQPMVSSAGLYESSEAASSELPRTMRVSVTVDTGLLAFIDDFVQRHPPTSRSAVFDQALEMWVLWMQKQNDIACYGSFTEPEKTAHQHWDEITMEAAKHIWP